MAEENSLVVVDPHRQRSMADVGVVASHTVLTPRLEVRLPVAADRERFVQLFRDERFMVFSGVLEVAAYRGLAGFVGSHERFGICGLQGSRTAWSRAWNPSLRTYCRTALRTCW